MVLTILHGFRRIFRSPRDFGMDWCQVSEHLLIIEIGKKNEKDIALFVKQRVRKLAAVRAAQPNEYAMWLESKIRQKVRAKADGMFFKVRLIVEQLQDIGRQKDIFDTIDAAPAKLEDRIAHVFERQVSDSNLNTADLSEILLWVSFAKGLSTSQNCFSYSKRMLASLT